MNGMAKLFFPFMKRSAIVASKLTDLWVGSKNRHGPVLVKYTSSLRTHVVLSLS